MSWLQKFQDLDRKYAPWSFLGFFFGTAFALFGIYTTFFHATHPRLRFEILSDAPVYDLREDVGKLDILFSGENIRQKHQMLSLINVRATNNGNADINKASFDEQSLPGFRFASGRIITVERTGASNDYLSQYAQLTQRGEKEVVLAPVILEQEQSAVFKVLLYTQKAPVLQWRCLEKSQA
jgi:hypothetical protein